MSFKTYPLTPSPISKVWGGNRLGEGIGETWEVSTHPDGPCFSGDSKLEDLLDEPLDYLVKFIDTKDYLSVQVHPGDEYARVHENSNGKTECWIILDATPGDGIYLGMKEGVTKESFQKALETSEDMSAFLNFYPVKRGDFFFVPAGSIHAIGKNVFLAEVQQSSGITYRVWDWNRLGMDGLPRELHVKKAMDVIDFDPSKNTSEYFQKRENLLSKNGEHQLVEHSHFNLKLIHHDGANEWSFTSSGRACSVLVLEGELSLPNSVVLKEGSAATMDPNSGESFSLMTESKASFLLIS